MTKYYKWLAQVNGKLFSHMHQSIPKDLVVTYEEGKDITAKVGKLFVLNYLGTYKIGLKYPKITECWEVSVTGVQPIYSRLLLNGKKKEEIILYKKFWAEKEPCSNTVPIETVDGIKVCDSLRLIKRVA